MSNHNQSNQRLRRNGSPSMKQGPIRATQQFAFTSPSRAITRGSPTSSPVSKENKVRTRPLSETGILNSNSGRRSPSSPCGFRIVDKPKPINANRSSSFDNGMAAPYLSGQWPKDGQWQQQKDSNMHYHPIGMFSADKQTQTPEEWEESPDRRRVSKLNKSKSQSAASGDQQLKTIKHKLQRNGGLPPSPAAHQQRLSPVLPSNSCLPAASSSSVPIKIPLSTSSTNGYFAPPRGTPGKARGSVEGLNQEVEKLIISGRKLDASESLVVEGHRAPVFELLAHTRSVDTQTPSQIVGEYPADSLPVMLEEAKDERGSSHESDDSPFGSSRDEDDEEEEESFRSASPSFIPGQFELEDSVLLDTNEENERTLSKAPPSPQPNSEFMRQPPDGAEKIKIIDELNIVPKALGSFTHHLIPSKTFQPSATSAFQCLPAVYKRNVTSSLATIEDAH